MPTESSAVNVTLKIKIDKRSREPKSRQVAQLIRELIEEGRLGPGDMLPSEDGLAARLGVGRKVVRQAYSTLVEERLLIRDFPRNKRVAGGTSKGAAKKVGTTKKAVTKKAVTKKAVTKKVGTTKNAGTKKAGAKKAGAK